MLRDLEVHLLAVRDPLSRAHMREATQCYGAGAYRAAVTLAVSACMYDLRRKLEELANSGAGAPVKAAHQAVESQWQNQQAYEAILLDQAKKVGLLSPDEHKKLHALLTIRHLCAHPSGHAASPEEARSAIADSIDIVLSRPPQLGGAQIEPLVDRLKGSVFFPPGSPTSWAAIVEQEMDRFHDRAVKGVASRIGALVASEPPGALRDNAVIFLGLMAKMEANAGDRPAWRAVDTLLLSAPHDLVFGVLSRAPTALGQPSADVTRLRAFELVRRSIAGSAPARSVAKAWRTAAVLTEEEVASLVTLVAGALLVPDADVAPASAATDELDWPELRTRYLDWLIDACDDSTFATANTALRWLIRPNAWEPAAFAPTQAAQLVLTIARAKKRNAHGAQEVVWNGILARHGLGSSLLLAVRAGKVPAFGSTSWPTLEEMIHPHMGGDTETAEVARGLLSSIETADQRYSVARDMARSKIESVKEVGKEVADALKAKAEEEDF